MPHGNFLLYTCHDLTPSKIYDEDPICNFLKLFLKSYVATWHFILGYNIVANDGEQLQTLYEWSTNEGAQVDRIHHPCEM